jgi:hypothetical protein
MGFHASTFLSTDTDSASVATAAARSLEEAFAQHPLRVVVVYASVSHDQTAILRAIRSVLGPDIPIVGCSVQGLAGEGRVLEEGYLLGVMGLGGSSLQVAVAVEREFQSDSREKGRALARQVRARLGETPAVTVLLYDPLCNADAEQLIRGFSSEVDCPLIGGGAGQPFGPISRTFQYWQDEVLGHSVIALALSGPFSQEIGVCHGTSPTGLDMVVTRSDGNRLLEIDGRPATAVWQEVIGGSVEEMSNQEFASNWAIGIQRAVPSSTGEQELLYFVRAAFGFDIEHGAVIVQAAIPEGTRIMLHHRIADVVLEGTTAMAGDLIARLKGRRPWAVLGFECGARTSPFLGEADTLSENLALQEAVAPRVPWLGMMAWGEIAPVGGKPAFHNYTYPLLVLAT